MMFRELLARVAAHVKLAQTRREMTQALRHRTAQFQTLLERAPVGVFLVDADLRIREINPVARRHFAEVAVLGRDLREFAPIEGTPEYLADQLSDLGLAVEDAGIVRGRLAGEEVDPQGRGHGEDSNAGLTR